MMCAVRDVARQDAVRVRFVCVPDEESEDVERRSTDALVARGPARRLRDHRRADRPAHRRPGQGRARAPPRRSAAPPRTARRRGSATTRSSRPTTSSAASRRCRSAARVLRPVRPPLDQPRADRRAATRSTRSPTAARSTSTSATCPTRTRARSWPRSARSPTSRSSSAFIARAGDRLARRTPTSSRCATRSARSIEGEALSVGRDGALRRGLVPRGRHPGGRVRPGRRRPPRARGVGLGRLAARATARRSATSSPSCPRARAATARDVAAVRAASTLRRPRDRLAEADGPPPRRAAGGCSCASRWRQRRDRRCSAPRCVDDRPALEVNDTVQTSSARRPDPRHQNVARRRRRPGKPQTILVLGSDRASPTSSAKDAGALGHDHARPAGSRRRTRPRSCRSRATSRSTIPGHGSRQDQRRVRARRPEARASRRSAACSDIPINHVVNVNFGGFRARGRTASAASTSTSTAATSTTTTRRRRRRRRTRRSTSSPATSGSAARTRSTTCASATSTTTSCAPRASRTSCARPRTRSASGKLFGDRKELLRIFGRYTQTDINSDGAILRLLKLASSRRSTRSRRSTSRRRQRRRDYVTITDDNLRRTVARVPRRARASGDRRSASRATTTTSTKTSAPRSAKQQARRRSRRARATKTQGEDHVARCRRKRAGFPVYYPAAARLAAAPTQRRQPARLHDLRPRRHALPRLPDRRLRRRHRPVLRRPGHELALAADPRRPERARADARAQATSCSTTATRLRLVAWRTTAGRLLGLEHAARRRYEPADAAASRSRSTRVGTQ